MVTAVPAPAQALTVFYTSSGTAVIGTDYTLDGGAGQITIPPGETTVNIAVHALTGQTFKRARTAKLQLGSGFNYNVPKKAGKAATIKIAQ
jgi:hypothetical protein